MFCMVYIDNGRKKILLNINMEDNSMQPYAKLFSPLKLGGQMLKNRIVMPSMATNSCNVDGSVSQTVISHYAKRARGGVGLIIIEFISVDFPAGRGSVTQLQLKEPFVRPGFHAIADAVHPYGTKVLAQLHHAGARSVPTPGVKLVGPVDEGEGTSKVYGMDKNMIADLKQKFVNAAIHAQQSGLDGIEIHAGHGYLLGQFLSPITNTRTDEYGGDTNGRAKFLLEIIDAIRKACGKNFIISVRLTVRDWADNGITIEEGVEFAKQVDKHGVDLINVTTGIKKGHCGASETMDKPEGFRLDLAKAVKPHVNAVVSVVGKLRTGEMCNEVIESGIADLVVVGRQLICDPNWPNKLREGREEEIRKCLSCMNGCYSSLASNSGVRCAINPYAGFDNVYDEDNLSQVVSPKNVVVVGGGVAGMQAAVTASERGNKVTLIEKTDCLGGQLHLANVPPDKEVINTTINYFENKLIKLGVDVHTGCQADADTVKGFKPDSVIIATGSLPAIPRIDGIDKAISSWKLLSGEVAMPEGEKVVVIGGGIVGCETALCLLKKNNAITIIEMIDKLASGQEGTHRGRDLAILKEGNVDIQLLACVQKVTDKGVEYINKDGETSFAEADVVVVSTGQCSVGADLGAELASDGINVKFAGDAISIGDIRSNVRSGFLVGYDA